MSAQGFYDALRQHLSATLCRCFRFPAFAAMSLDPNDVAKPRD
jgi:hypothetical protein